MTGAHRDQGYGAGSIVLGWAVMAVYIVHMVITVLMPRTEKSSVLREDLRSWHYLLGLTLFVLVIWRLVRWLREAPITPAAGVSPSAHLWTRTLAGTTYLVLAVMPVLGITQAWTHGLTVRLGPFVALPALVAENHVGWMFSGYFHSALAFTVTLLSAATVLTGAWLMLRHGVGLLRSFAPGFGAQAWVALLVTVYAFATLARPEPGIPAAGTYLGLTAAVWLAARIFHRDRLRSQGRESAGPAARVATVLGVLALIGVAGYAPHAMFRVTPWPMGEVIAAPEGVTSHPAPVAQVTIAPETDFERQVREDTYKWCRFCHTVEKGDKHLIGPNLYAIFGQQAGTVPNFYYSSAMAAAGRNGLVWTDETLDRYLAGPDRFVPGTSMIISSGPVRTPDERAAVINILKKETMPAAGR